MEPLDIEEQQRRGDGGYNEGGRRNPGLLGNVEVRGDDFWGGDGSGLKERSCQPREGEGDLDLQGNWDGVDQPSVEGESNGGARGKAKGILLIRGQQATEGKAPGIALETRVEPVSGKPLLEESNM